MTSPTDKTPEDLPIEPILTLENVIIRPLRLEDAPASSRLANEWDIAKNMRNTFPYPYELSHATGFITTGGRATHSTVLVDDVEIPDDNDAATTTDNGEKVAVPPKAVLINYAIVRRSDGAFMGGLGVKPLKDVQARTMGVGYWIGREFRGHGYTTEAVRGLCQWAFATFPQLLRLEADVHGGNGASVRVLEKVGFQAEGVRRKAVWKADQSLDLLVFGMLREESPGLSTTT